MKLTRAPMLCATPPAVFLCLVCACIVQSKLQIITVNSSERKGAPIYLQGICTYSTQLSRLKLTRLFTWLQQSLRCCCSCLLQFVASINELLLLTATTSCKLCCTLPACLPAGPPACVASQFAVVLSLLNSIAAVVDVAVAFVVVAAAATAFAALQLATGPIKCVVAKMV